jgi:DTW domain-containing protein
MTRAEFISQPISSNLTQILRDSPSPRGFGASRCVVCKMQTILCICELVPSINCDTRVSLIIPINELRKSSNTGQLAHRCLQNSSLHLKGVQDTHLDEAEILSSTSYASAILYPCDGAIDLATFKNSNTKKINLIVPDGTWKQARKILKRSSCFAELPKVTIPTADSSPYILRRNHSVDQGLATIEAIAIAIGILEGSEARNSLRHIFRIMVERTLFSRGLLKEKEVYGPRWK